MALLNIHPEYCDSLGLTSTNEFWPGYLAVYARKGVSFNNIENFSGKRVAVMKEVYITQKYIESLKHKINIIEVDNALEGLQKVQKGDVDYFFGFSPILFLFLNTSCLMLLLHMYLWINQNGLELGLGPIIPN